jgi:SOS response regulatory protein OraA/RecX
MKERARQYRFLLARGFDAATIQQVLKGYVYDQDASDFL